VGIAGDYKLRIKMKKLLLALASLLLFPFLANAQTTLQVTDTASQTWNNGTWFVQLTPPNGYTVSQLRTNGNPVPNPTQNGTLSGTGSSSITLTTNTSIAPSPSTWLYTVCPNATSGCFNQAVSITTSNQAVTLTPPPPVVFPGPNALAYTDAEISGAIPGSTYYNTVSNTQRICNGPSPCSWGSGGAGGAPAQWINAITTSGAKRDGHPITYTVNSSGVVTGITSGNCSSSDIGKNIYATYGGGANNLTTNFAQIATCTPGSTFTTSGGTPITAAVTAAGFIGSDDLTAINACLAAAYAASSECYLPGGGINNPYWVSANITDPGSVNAYVFAGDSIESTRIVFPPANTVGQFINAGNYHAVYRDFTVDPGIGGGGGPYSSGSTCSQALATMNVRTYRVALNNWQCTGSGGQPCFGFGADNIQASEIESTGCYNGIGVAATSMTIIRPIISSKNYALFNNDASTVILGGNIGGGTNDVFANCQGCTPNGYGTLYLTDVTMQQVTSGTAINTLSGSTTWIKGGIVGGGKGCGTSGNSGGINIVSGATVHIYGAQLCSSGVSNTITNAGAFYDDGGSIYPSIGAAIYSGSSGTVNGRSFLTGSAYTNATTSFTAVTGSTGEPFAWHVNVGEPLNVTCHLYYQAAATGGLNIEFTGPAAPTSLAYGLNDPNAATTFNSSVATSFSTSLGQVVTTATTNFDATVSLSMLNGTTAGTVTLLAKSSAAVNLTIQPGSYCQSQ
jgi:hypothetical protein